MVANQLTVNNNVKEKLIQNLPGEALVVLGLAETVLAQYESTDPQFGVIVLIGIVGSCFMTLVIKYVSDVASTLKWVISNKTLGRRSYAILCTIQAFCYCLGVFNAAIFPSAWTLVFGLVFTVAGLIIAAVMAYYFK